MLQATGSFETIAIPDWKPSDFRKKAYVSPKNKVTHHRCIPIITFD